MRCRRCLVAPVWIALATGVVNVAAAAPVQSTQVQRATCAGDDSRAAIAACTDLLKLKSLDNTSRVEVYVNRGNAYDELGDSDHASKDYDAALAINPRDARAHRNKGAMFNRQGRLSEALVEFNRAIELQPDYAFAYGSRGSNLRAQADLSLSDSTRRALYERALSDYDRMINLGGLAQREAAAYEERAAVNHSLRRFDAAITDFTKAIELAPDYGPAYSGRADSVRVKAGLATSQPERALHYERAVTDYDTAIRLGGLGQREGLAHANRGFAHYYLGQLDVAIADFTKAMEFLPGASFLYTARAIAYADNKECGSAVADAERASALTNALPVPSQITDVRNYIAQRC